MVNWKQDFLLAVVLLALAVGFYGYGLTYPQTSFLFPSYLAPILGVLAILLGISAVRRIEPGQSICNWANLRGPLLLAVLTALFIVILPYIGFIPACTLLTASFFLTMGFPNKIFALGVAILASVLVWAVFDLALKVALPMGSLFVGE